MGPIHPCVDPLVLTASHKKCGSLSQADLKCSSSLPSSRLGLSMNRIGTIYPQTLAKRPLCKWVLLRRCAQVIPTKPYGAGATVISAS